MPFLPDSSVYPVVLPRDCHDPPINNFSAVKLCSDVHPAIFVVTLSISWLALATKRTWISWNNFGSTLVKCSPPRNISASSHSVVSQLLIFDYTCFIHWACIVYVVHFAGWDTVLIVISHQKQSHLRVLTRHNCVWSGLTSDLLLLNRSLDYTDYGYRSSDSAHWWDCQ